METLTQYFKETFFGEILPFSTALLGLIIYLNLKYKNKSLKIFAIYLGLYCLLPLYNWLRFGVLSYAMKGIFFQNITQIFDYLFTVFEFLVFQKMFIKNVEIGKKFLNIQKEIFLLFATIMFISSIVTIETIRLKYLHILFTIQAFFLIISCSLYFINLLINPPLVPLQSIPSFWIATGVFFFTFCTLPYSLLLNFHAYDQLAFQLFILFNLFYFILFLLIIRAFLCQKTIEK